MNKKTEKNTDEKIERKDKTKELNSNYALCFFNFKNNLDKEKSFTIINNDLDLDLGYTDIKDYKNSNVKKWIDQTTESNNLIQSDLNKMPKLHGDNLLFKNSEMELEKSIKIKKNRFTLIIHFDLNRQTENEGKFVFKSYKNSKNEIAIRIKSETELEFILDNTVLHTILIDNKIDQYICWRYHNVGDAKMSSVIINGNEVISDSSVDIDVLVKQNMKHSLNANMKLYKLAFYSWNIDTDQIIKIK